MRRAAVLAPLLALALAACGARADTASPAGTSPVATTARAPGMTATAPTALQFAADRVGGGSLDFRTLTGHTIALWFWAPT